MVIERSIDAFEQHDAIDGIVVVIHPDYVEEMKTIAERNQWKKMSHIVEGGKERFHSSVAALKCCETLLGKDCLLIHDAARPMVNKDLITRVVDALDQHQAVVAGIPTTDTVWQLSSQGTIESVPDRNRLYLAQTPQAFHLDVLRQAYESALKDADLKATDDCGVVLRYMPEVAIHVVEGSTTNVKITYPEDIKKSNHYYDTFCIPYNPFN